MRGGGLFFFFGGGQGLRDIFSWCGLGRSSSVGGLCSLGLAGGLWGFSLYFFSYLHVFGGLGVLDHGAVFDVCTLLFLHAIFLGLDIPDTVHLFVMGLYIAAR